MSDSLSKLRGLFRRATKSVEAVAEGEEPVATPARTGTDADPDRETSTNAQVEGAADEPWSGT